jgi:D-arabinose 1-dehydrogenase-like Zn-dependent alcohol dehydrogenase
MLDGWGYTPELPFIMGHEPSGIVVEVGANVSRFRVGDRVVPNIFLSCGNCFYCRTNRETQCLHLRGILGVIGHGGGYGEYFRVPERQLYPLPDSVAMDEGAVIADAVVTAVHAAERGRVSPGETTVIIGVGGCGGAAVQISKMLGATVIAVDISDEKRKHALALGADEAILSADSDVPETVRSAIEGLGAHCVIDTVGNAATLQQAADLLRRGGRLVILGYTQERFPLDPRQVVVNELEVLGTRSGGRQATVDAIRFVSDERWKPIVTDRFPIAQVNEALDLMRSGEALGRIVLLFD